MISLLFSAVASGLVLSERRSKWTARILTNWSRLRFSAGHPQNFKTEIFPTNHKKGIFSPTLLEAPPGGAVVHARRNEVHFCVKARHGCSAACSKTLLIPVIRDNNTLMLINSYKCGSAGNSVAQNVNVFYATAHEEPLNRCGRADWCCYWASGVQMLSIYANEAGVLSYWCMSWEI